MLLDRDHIGKITINDKVFFFIHFHCTIPLHMFLRYDNVYSRVWQIFCLFTLELRVTLRSLATSLYLRTERFLMYVFNSCGSSAYGERSKRKTIFPDSNRDNIARSFYSIKTTYSQQVTCVPTTPRTGNKSVKIIYLLEICHLGRNRFVSRHRMIVRKRSFGPFPCVLRVPVYDHVSSILRQYF